MSPNTFRPPTITFNPSIFPFFLFPSSLPVRCGGSRSFAFVAVEGKVRPSPLLCLLLSFLSSVPPPYLCSSYCLPPLPLTYSNWSGVEWVRKGEGGTHARQWTFDPSTLWTFCHRLAISLEIQPLCSLDNKPGFFLVLCLAWGWNTEEQQQFTIFFYSLVSLKVVTFLYLWLSLCYLACLGLSLACRLSG